MISLPRLLSRGRTPRPAPLPRTLSVAGRELPVVIRRLRTLVTSKYGRHKLANDGTRFGEGQAIVTPAVIKGELNGEYRIMERLGIVENSELFAKYLIVERDGDSGRVNVLFPPDYVNGLRIFALLNQFRLQYQEAA